jgi:hypothetical protein
VRRRIFLPYISNVKLKTISLGLAILTSSALTSIAAAQSAPAAASTYFGVNTLGVQATYDAGPYAVRLSVGARTVLGLVYGVGADVAGLYAVYNDPQASSKLSLGAGVDLNYYFASPLVGLGGGSDVNASVLTYRPNVLVNYEHSVSNRSSFFIETSLGYAIVPGVGGAIYPGVRLGLNFH